jgi:hypothetical protein
MSYTVIWKHALVRELTALYVRAWEESAEAAKPPGVDRLPGKGCPAAHRIPH